MAKRYFPRFTLSLAVLAVTLLLQAAPALAGPAGAVGSSLTEAANAYLRSILEAESDRLALEKARLENELLRAQTERLRAQTERYAQPCTTHTSTYQGRTIICEVCCTDARDGSLPYGPSCESRCH